MGDAAALADGAEDVDLVLVSADLARCGLGVVGAVAVGVAAVGLEALQGAVELVGADAHQDVADDELAGHLVAAVPVPAVNAD